MDVQHRRVLWTATAIASGITTLACYVSGLTLSSNCADAVALYAAIMAIALYLDPFPFGRLAVAADALMLFIIVSMIAAIGSYVAMQHSGALTDGLLDRADRSMGMSWPAIRDFVEQRPFLLTILTVAYRACGPMPAIIAVLLCMTGHSDRCYQFIKLHAVALTVTIGIAFFFPAVAAFVFYGHNPLPGNAIHYGRIIAGLRNGSFTTIDIRDLGGIITFPSFHATMAIFFTWALWPVRKARIAAVVVNGLMWLSAVPIGGHYVIDVVGGSMIALAAIALAGGTRERAWLPQAFRGIARRLGALQFGQITNNGSAARAAMRAWRTNSGR